MAKPDNTAVRTALWGVLHVQVDSEPHIFENEIGLKLIAPSDEWQQRPDMKFTKRLRASIIARGTPFNSFFAPDEILTLAREAGFKESKAISTKDMEQLYFANRTDNLLSASGEVFLLATT